MYVNYCRNKEWIYIFNRVSILYPFNFPRYFQLIRNKRASNVGNSSVKRAHRKGFLGVKKETYYLSNTPLAVYSYRRYNRLCTNRLLGSSNKRSSCNRRRIGTSPRSLKNLRFSFQLPKLQSIFSKTILIRLTIQAITRPPTIVRAFY